MKEMPFWYIAFDLFVTAQNLPKRVLVIYENSLLFGWLEQYMIAGLDCTQIHKELCDEVQNVKCSLIKHFDFSCAWTEFYF